MEYKVLLDTNVYEAANFTFLSSRFKALQRFSELGQLRILCCSVISGEVEKHIRQQAKEAARNFNHCLKEYSRKFAPYLAEEKYASRLEKLKSEEMEALCLQRFRDFLSITKAEMLPANSIDTEAMITDYFLQNAPFQKKKPDEFKDAIIIRAFKEYLSSQSQKRENGVTYCVVSEDNGFRAGLTRLLPEESAVQIYACLNDFLKYLTLLNKRICALTEFLNSDGAYDEINDALKKYIENASYYVEEPTDEFELLDVNDVSFELLWVDIAGEHEAKAAFEVKAEIQVWYSYIDEERSFYDKEDDCYLWKAEVEVSETHQICFELTLDIDISGFSMHTDDPEIGEGEYDFDFDSDEITVIDTIDDPDSITLDESTCTESEVKTSDPFDDRDGEREYALDVCPDCGNPIGLTNDGGNGFCKNCAPNH